jgi:hypothetical protein
MAWTRFIQWLFPVFESSGVNWDAEALSKVPKSSALPVGRDRELQ